MYARVHNLPTGSSAVALLALMRIVTPTFGPRGKEDHDHIRISRLPCPRGKTVTVFRFV